MEELEQRYAPLSPTWAVETGGGGLHFYFTHPGVAVRNSAGRLGPGVDVRGDGGFAIAPPSRHASGTSYCWASDWSPARHPLARAPKWLLELVVSPPRPESAPASAASTIPEGQRNSTLASLAGSMRRRGFGDAAILAALQAENAERCVPPLSEAEVERIARSILRYPAGSPIQPRLNRRSLRVREVRCA